MRTRGSSSRSDQWHTGGIDIPDGDDPDGANRLFKVLVKGAPMAYHRFAEEYYVTAVDPKTVSETFALRPLTDELVRRLNADLVVADLAQDRYRPGRHSGSPHRADRRRARSVDRGGRWTFFRRHRPHINKIALEYRYRCVVARHPGHAG